MGLLLSKDTAKQLDTIANMLGDVVQIPFDDNVGGVIYFLRDDWQHFVDYLHAVECINSKVLYMSESPLTRLFTAYDDKIKHSMKTVADYPTFCEVCTTLHIPLFVVPNTEVKNAIHDYVQMEEQAYASLKSALVSTDRYVDYTFRQ